MKKVYLITKNFPYGNEEKAFLEPEFLRLKRKFNIDIIMTEEDSGLSKIENKEVNLIHISERRSIFEKIISLSRFLMEKDCCIELKNIIKSGKYIGKRFWRALMFGSCAETFYRRFRKKTGINKDTEAIIYFYWFDYKCFGLTMHKKEYHNIKIISRTHGYDLYDMREKYGKQFFKEQMDRELNRLVFAADYAKQYYLKRYQKKDGKKYPLHRLGVCDKGITEKMKKEQYTPDTFLILSCSHTISIKRVELIIEGLSLVKNENIQWVHIGDGKGFSKIQCLADQKLRDKDNVVFTLLGAVPNEKVIQYYRDHYVGAFITTTSTEGGSPVSVQEALSFGVPVIATAVGELPVMVQDNGVLLPENPTAQEVAEGILRMREVYGTDIYFKMCDRSLEIFHDKFDADKNYEAMAEELLLLANEK